MQDTQPEHPDRVQRLEESIAFSAHEVEQLHEAILDVASRMESLGTRLARLEHRLDALEEPKNDEGEPDDPADDPAGA